MLCIVQQLIFCFSSASSFVFEEACFFCGEPCDTEPDQKHPDCWARNPGYLCRTADRGKDELGNKKMTFKEVLLEVSDEHLLCLYNLFLSLCQSVIDMWI